MMGELGVALKSPPVLSPHEVSWQEPSGIMLRSFAKEDSALGARALAQIVKGLTEVRIQAGRWSVRGASKRVPLRWLAIVRPGQHFITPGIQRVALTNEGWQWWIVEAIANAEIILVILGKTGGLAWEIQRVVAADAIDRLRILILPEHSKEDRDSFFADLTSITTLPAPELPNRLTVPVMVWWINATPQSESWDYQTSGSIGWLAKIMTGFSAR